MPYDGSEVRGDSSACLQRQPGVPGKLEQALQPLVQLRLICHRNPQQASNHFEGVTVGVSRHQVHTGLACQTIDQLIRQWPQQRTDAAPYGARVKRAGYQQAVDAVFVTLHTEQRLALGGFGMPAVSWAGGHARLVAIKRGHVIVTQNNPGGFTQVFDRRHALAGIAQLGHARVKIGQRINRKVDFREEPITGGCAGGGAHVLMLFWPHQGLSCTA